MRQRRNTRRWVWSAVTGLTVLAAVALYQGHQARVQRDEAIARGLAARAQVLLDQEGKLLGTVALLAVEAMRRSPSLDSDRAIRRVLSVLPKRVAEMDCAAGGEVEKAAFSPDGRYLATYSGDRACLGDRRGARA